VKGKVIIMAIVMNKVSVKSKQALKFEDLGRGDIFKSGGGWYMKIYDSYSDCGDFEGNAITLENGCKALFDGDETVAKLKKDLVVEYTNDDITEWCE
jgi:hypothetical protein